MEPLHTANIFIIDDDTFTLKLLDRLLSQEGYRVSTYISVLQAIADAPQMNPDMILMDIKMEEMDGFDAGIILKADEKTAHIPIIFVTVMDQPQNIVRGFEVGAVDYITKPIQKQELLARLQIHLSLHQYQLQLMEQNEQLKQSIYERDLAENKSKQDQRFIQTILDNLPNMIYMKDAHGNLSIVNRAFAKFWEYDAAKIVGKHNDDLILQPEERQKIRQDEERVLKENQSITIEESITSPSGMLHWFLTTKMLFLQIDDNAHILGISTDITGLKQIESELQASRDLLQSVMDSVPFPIFYKNKEGIYSACNKAFSNYLGIEKSKIIGRTIYDILPLERAQYFSQQEQELIFNKQDQIQEQQAVYADGSLHDVIFYRSSVSDSTEDIIGIVCTIIDISDRKRLEQVEKRLLSEMQALYQTMMDITRELDLPKLLRAIIERLIDLLGADGGELALYDQEEEKLTILVSFLEEQDRCGEKICLGEGYLGKAAAERKPFLIKDTTQEEGNECIQISKIPQAVLAAPLLSGQKLLGAVSVNVDSRTHVFDIQDIYIIEMFAYQAAVAIENANLYNEVQRLAITDELTGLSNRRALMEYAQNEFARTKRYRSSLSIIMFDLDRFKKLNDSYGHIAGDEVLRDIGKLCKAIFRNVDIIGRYGGEEFLVLLPETPLSEAVHTAERLRRAVEERRIPFKEHHLQVTISLGVAEYVTEDNSIDMLIDRVDQAMYRAKTMSRNTVST